MSVGIYLNRLSDFLFAATRHASAQGGIAEVIYKSSSAQKSNDSTVETKVNSSG
jgi:cob(I)alamin adenosyltransferase